MTMVWTFVQRWFKISPSFAGIEVYLAALREGSADVTTPKREPEIERKALLLSDALAAVGCKPGFLLA